jgi:hypothetical protein
MWGDYLMIDRINARIDAWEQLPWTPRGKKVKIVVEFVVLFLVVLVGSIDIK